MGSEAPIQGAMTAAAAIALFGWIPITLVMYLLLPHRLAAAIAVIGAWLFLPPYVVPIAGLPDFSKNVAATMGMMLGTLIFASDRLSSFQPRWFDLLMVLWCLCGIPSSLLNDLGLYDGVADAMAQVITWGLPYLLGRLYFSTLEDLRFFAVAMVVGGICYMPFLLWEILTQPSLLHDIYGIGSVKSEIRMGGQRPHVFFSRGLECGMWMTAAALAGLWLWYCGALKKIASIPFGVILPILLAMTVLCRSLGALVLLILGAPLLWVSVRFRTRWLMIGLLCVGPVYATLRASNMWSGRHAVEFAIRVVGAGRAESLGYRFQCEDQLAKKALERPIFGWGGWGRARVLVDPLGPNTDANSLPTDGLWIIMLGAKGIAGLALFIVVIILPAILFTRRFPARLWGTPLVAAGSFTAAVSGLYMVDLLLNGFVNIIYLTLGGGLIGIDLKQIRGLAVPRGEIAGRQAPRSRAVAAIAGRQSSQIMLADRCRTLGRSFKQEGRFDEADDAWRRALELLGAGLQIEPDSAEARRRWCDCANDLAWLRANHPDPARRDPDSAVLMASRAVNEYPDAAAYWNTLGAAHYRAGDDRAAITALEHARTLGCGTAFDDVFLAMTYARLGELGEARQALARAMLQAERDHPGHSELAALCAEAQSSIAGGATAVR
jgi:tetratricopeptide (TPR) repeat protein